MKEGYFYFLKDSYFKKVEDEKLSLNKGDLHGRPCFFSFEDNKTGVKWMVPISSKVEKYKGIYEKKVKKLGKCDTIVFAYVRGQERAFLIQNMCPVIDSYIQNEYIDINTNEAVVISNKSKEEVIKKSKKVLGLVRKGFSKLVFTDILGIEAIMVNELVKNEAAITLKTDK